MILLFFAIFFVLINIGLWKWAKTIWLENPAGNISNELCYITYVKGSVRGIIGKFESDASLEEKRLALKKKNSKF